MDARQRNTTGDRSLYYKDGEFLTHATAGHSLLDDQNMCVQHTVLAGGTDKVPLTHGNANVPFECDAPYVFCGSKTRRVGDRSARGYMSFAWVVPPAVLLLHRWLQAFWSIWSPCRHRCTLLWNVPQTSSRPMRTPSRRDCQRVS